MTRKDQEVKIPSLRTRRAMRETKLIAIINKHIDAMYDEICDEFEKALEAELSSRSADKK